MAWNRLVYTNENELRNALSDLATVMARDSTGEKRIVGSAFPLIVSDSHIVLASALHMVEHGYRNSSQALRERTRKLDHFPGPDNDPYVRMGAWAGETSDLTCMFVVKDQIVECPITGVCLRPPLDIALLVVDAKSLEDKVDVFQINSDPLGIGDEVVITSFVTEGNTRTLIGRYGRITGVDSKGPLVQAPVYTTNIPVEGGASGGPVFKYLGHFEGPKEVVGVVSSDLSPEEAFTNTDVDGSSRASMICSAAPLQLESQTEVLTFKEMCARGIIRDSGTAMNKLVLTYHPDGNWHQLIPMRRLQGKS